MRNKKRIRVYMRDGSLLDFESGITPYIVQQQYLYIPTCSGLVVHLLTTEVIRWDVYER